MFSTTPMSGTLTWANIAMPRRASISARSCGVETITAPASGTFWAIVSCVSPVPGGISTTSTSSSPHKTSRKSWLSAEITMGPRQTTGAPSSIKKPIDITLTPQLSSGTSFWPSGARLGFERIPNSLGIDGPNKSASRTPTLRPSFASPTARLQATVDLPTPPLPEATAMMCLTPGSGSLGRPCRRGGASARCA